ncbi:MAG: hypothetical protein ACJAVO_001186 [Parvibaculaceae bacterium]
MGFLKVGCGKLLKIKEKFLICLVLFTMFGCRLGKQRAAKNVEEAKLAGHVAKVWGWQIGFHLTAY